MNAFLVSTGIVALGEIGDKTQLLAFMLAAKFRRPAPIVLGILVATILNHALAGIVGSWATTLVSPSVLRWILGGSFVAMAAWTLIPDKLDEKEAKLAKYGAFLTTLFAFFLAEMGDKTQVATIALAAQFKTVLPVVAGTTLGILIADIPAVFIGDRAAKIVPVRVVHMIAAALFAIIGIATLLGAGSRFGF
ncbi:MAG: TMEM165/GDT1 family protein [Fibrobacteres bacterium]|nr:TMEM165/GDT1 family protein [Fibrobacterota bacterium]